MSETQPEISQEAARAMLDALRDLLDAIERDIPGAASITTGPMQAARAAIAKAEGR